MRAIYRFAIDVAARLNDIGKVGIPDSVLLKPGKLSRGERDVMCAHAIIGAELLANSKIPQLRMAEEIARHHHEWWDGNGYPDGLAGDSIPICARIVAIADVFDALTHHRPYRNALSIDDAIQVMSELKGRQFDPALVTAFFLLIADLKSHYLDLDRYLGSAAQNSPLLLAKLKIKSELERLLRAESREEFVN